MLTEPFTKFAVNCTAAAEFPKLWQALFDSQVSVRQLALVPLRDVCHSVPSTTNIVRWWPSDSRPPPPFAFGVTNEGTELASRLHLKTRTMRFSSEKALSTNDLHAEGYKKHDIGGFLFVSCSRSCVDMTRCSLMRGSQQGKYLLDASAEAPEISMAVPVEFSWQYFHRRMWKCAQMCTRDNTK